MDYMGRNGANELNRPKRAKMHKSVLYGQKLTKWTEYIEVNQNVPMQIEWTEFEQIDQID